MTTRDEPLKGFVLWAFSALKMDCAGQSDGTFRVQLPPQRQQAFDGKKQLEFRIGRAAANRETELLASASPLFQQLVECLIAGGQALHAAPREQPESVHELSQILFNAYAVDGGHVRLGGCTLEDRPLLRITLPQAEDQLVHYYVDQAGQQVSDELVNELGLADLITLKRPARRLKSGELARWQETAGQVVSANSTGAKPLLVTVIWCHYATGTLLFSIGRQSAEVSFAGWASQLATKRVKPPPYRCPLSHHSSYNLVLTDDNQLTVAEAIATCSETGRRVLSSVLETCSLTGRQALPEHMRDCPVSGERVVASALVSCEMCREQVSPTVIRRGRCAACRGLENVTKYEPRIVRLTSEYSGLDRWRRWRMAETATVYIAVASSLLRRLLLVVDKQGLEVRHVATCTAPFSTWRDCEPNQRDELLGTRA